MAARTTDRLLRYEGLRWYRWKSGAAVKKADESRRTVIGALDATQGREAVDLSEVDLLGELVDLDGANANEFASFVDRRGPFGISPGSSVPQDAPMLGGMTKVVAEQSDEPLQNLRDEVFDLRAYSDLVAALATRSAPERRKRVAILVKVGEESARLLARRTDEKVPRRSSYWQEHSGEFVAHEQQALAGLGTIDAAREFTRARINHEIRIKGGITVELFLLDRSAAPVVALRAQRLLAAAWLDLAARWAGRVPAPSTCAWCGRGYLPDLSGRRGHGMYHANACKQAAKRARKAARELAANGASETAIVRTTGAPPGLVREWISEMGDR